MEMNRQGLSAHRPEHPLDSIEFRRWIEVSDLRDVLPSRLNESVLLGLARELREPASPGAHGDTGHRTSPPILMVTRLLMGRKRQTKGLSSDLRPLDAELGRALYVLQFAIDKEIVSRILGIGGEACDEFLLAALDGPKAERYNATRRKRLHTSSNDAGQSD